MLIQKERLRHFAALCEGGIGRTYPHLKRGRHFLLPWHHLCWVSIKNIHVHKIWNVSNFGYWHINNHFKYQRQDFRHSTPLNHGDFLLKISLDGGIPCPQKAVDNFDPQRKEMARDNIFLNADDIGSLEMSFFPLGVVEVLNALNWWWRRKCKFSNFCTFLSFWPI